MITWQNATAPVSRWVRQNSWPAAMMGAMALAAAAAIYCVLALPPPPGTGMPRSSQTLRRTPTIAPRPGGFASMANRFASAAPGPASIGSTPSIDEYSIQQGQASRPQGRPDPMTPDWTVPAPRVVVDGGGRDRSSASDDGGADTALSPLPRSPQDVMNGQSGWGDQDAAPPTPPVFVTAGERSSDGALPPPPRVDRRSEASGENSMYPPELPPSVSGGFYGNDSNRSQDDTDGSPRVTGVLSNGDQMMAVVDPGNGKHGVIVQPGDSVGASRVLSVSADGVTIQSPSGKRFTLPLSTSTRHPPSSNSGQVPGDAYGAGLPPSVN